MKITRANLNITEKYPIKIIQFGEGNFLRAFVDYAFHKLNKEFRFNAGIAVIQPIEKGMVEILKQQEGLYTLFMNGVKKGEKIQEKELITNIVKTNNPYLEFGEMLNLAHEEELAFVISNTTEAGIAYVESDTAEMTPPSSYPAKLTLLLYERFKFFGGKKDKGLSIIPCELINYNADTLKEIILKYIEDWKLGNEFKIWILESNSFHNTLVDRIVPGYPKDEIELYNKQLNYQDNLLITAESFFLWVIEGDEKLKEKLPFHKTKLDVKIVESIQPYRNRKVRILNGAHTSIVPLSIMYGNETVEQTMNCEFTLDFIKNLVVNEIIETLEMDKNELLNFAEEVFDRFRNPFIKHYLSTIALNSVSKFKVRVLSGIEEFQQKKGYLPKHIVFSFAALIRFYKGTWNDKQLPLDDEASILNEFNEIWKLKNYSEIAEKTLGKIEFWGKDLNAIVGLTSEISKALLLIETHGVEVGFTHFNS